MASNIGEEIVRFENINCFDFRPINLSYRERLRESDAAEAAARKLRMK